MIWQVRFIRKRSNKVKPLSGSQNINGAVSGFFCPSKRTKQRSTLQQKLV
jgi:hypothetical protein